MFRCCVFFLVPSFAFFVCRRKYIQQNDETGGSNQNTNCNYSDRSWWGSVIWGWCFSSLIRRCILFVDAQVLCNIILNSLDLTLAECRQWLIHRFAGTWTIRLKCWIRFFFRFWLTCLSASWTYAKIMKYEINNFIYNLVTGYLYRSEERSIISKDIYMHTQLSMWNKSLIWWVRLSQ